jgi:glycerol-3-phosphate dehydrogenase
MSDGEELSSGPVISEGLRRGASLERVTSRSKPWDITVIGGGATGIGVAMDAAVRGLSVLLVERSDFGIGTSSRSTKLVHGGVRYLQQGNLTLVRDALRERARLRENAPHLVHDLPFLIPCRNLGQRMYYTAGLKLYDLLAKSGTFGRSRGVSGSETRRLVPNLQPKLARSGVVYHDGQFDDTRLLIAMARTAADHGACLINYMAAQGMTKDRQGRVTGVELVDTLSGQAMEVRSRCVINAAGPFCDEVRRLDDPQAEPLVAASQGVHLVLPRRFFPGNVALIIPKTSDGRVLFLIPWHDHVLVGTTDTSIPQPVVEPTAQPQEIRFLLDTAAIHLAEAPGIEDVLSIFTGVRPLVRDDRSRRTSLLSRDHRIEVSGAGLITITGGKWTTVRKMSEDCVDRAIGFIGLDAGRCQTEQLRLHGFQSEPAPGTDAMAWRNVYGSDVHWIEAIESESPDLAQALDPDLPYRGSEVVWSTRYEMAQTVEDVLSRRTRALLLNARAAIRMAPRVAQLMAAELGHDQDWCDHQFASFRQLAHQYLPSASE